MEQVNEGLKNNLQMQGDFPCEQGDGEDEQWQRFYGTIT